MKLNCGKIDLTDIEMLSHEQEEYIKAAISDSARTVTKILLSQIKAYFPATWPPCGDGWNGDNVDEPLTVYFTHEEDLELFAAIDLSSVLERAAIDAETGSIPGCGIKIISRRLRQMADRLDDAFDASIRHHGGSV